MLKHAATFCFAIALPLAACSPPVKPADTAAAPAPADPIAAASANDTSGGALATKPVEAGAIIVANPLSGARVSSPLAIEGSAINTFFFEAVFPIQIVANGKVLAEAPAQAQTDWTAEGQVKFKSTITFDVTAPTQAELVLAEDMPKPASPDSDEPGPARALRMPITLMPKS